jgi:hypothetical protein
MATVKNKKWYLFQEKIAELLSEIDPNARSTKASGGSTEKGDVRNNVNLNIECKCYNTKSPYDDEWLVKAQQEIPLHSDKIAIVCTENKEGKFRVHLDGDDFFRMYNELYKYRQGEI